MLELSLNNPLKPELQFKFKKIKEKLTDNRITVIPKTLGKGQLYFTEVMSGISIVIIDATYTSEVVIKSIQLDQSSYILQFHVSDEINEYLLGDVSCPVFNSSFSILTNKTENYLRPIVGNRIFLMYLLVDKILLNKYIEEKDIERRVYNFIDSNSSILIYSLKQKSMFGIAFDSYLKGISLKLLSNFINNYLIRNSNKINSLEINAVLNTKEYLLKNLLNPFPSIFFLSRMAGMSPTKYKSLFKRTCNFSPNQFFIREKLNLANKLLKSKKFSTIEDILLHLNYPNKYYFSMQYFRYFKRKPAKDFKKK